MSPRAAPYLPLAFQGRVETPTVESAALRGNRAGDPSVRELPIYLPPGWDAPGARFPVVFLLASFTSRGHSYLDTHPWHRGAVSRFDQAIAKGEMPPAILAMPDCFTRLGGSQYVNSAYNGGYEDHVVGELVPFVDSHYPSRPGPRAVAGKSSGGFGALHLGMRHPEVFAAVASLSGDCSFEDSLGPELLSCLRGLVPFQGDPARFLESFLSEPDLSGDAHAVINVLAMAACYSSNPASPLGFDLPMDLRTGARIESVWRRWLEFDPLHAVELYAANLKRLRLLHLECGLRDEYHIQWGTRRLSDKLKALGVPHNHEEHEAGHRGLDHRLLALLPKAIDALS